MIELANCTQQLLEEIANPKMYRLDVARTYALAIKSTEDVDWYKANEAIVARWSPYALRWIKEKAWSGKCFPRKLDKSTPKTGRA